MKRMNKTTTIFAVGLLMAAVPDHSAAKDFYVTPGVGLGLGSQWSSAGLAVGLAGTYRDGARSISARCTYSEELGLFVSPAESVTELAVLAGLSISGNDRVSAGFHLGLGTLWSTRRGKLVYSDWFDARYEPVTTTSWGMAWQADAFIKRVGLSIQGNVNNSVSYAAVLFSVRIGNIYDK